MLLTPELQQGIKTYLSRNQATYSELCDKISTDRHDRPSESTVSRWLAGRVKYIQDPLAMRLLEVIGMDAPGPEPSALLGLSNFSLELAQQVEFMPPKYRSRIRRFVSDELGRYVAESNRANRAGALA